MTFSMLGFFLGRKKSIMSIHHSSRHSEEQNDEAIKSFSGFGIGLRPCHYESVINTRPAVDWFEIVSEDFMGDGGPPFYYLDKIRERFPIAMHGVSLSIGSCDDLDKDYLVQLKKLIERVDPLWVSDHLCWTGINGVNIHDLMPLPHTRETISHVVSRVKKVQNFLGRKILLENVSSYVSFKASEMTEWEFLTEIAERAGCYILLDVNNIYVNAFNHGFDAQTYLNYIPAGKVKQFHMAGHENCGTHIVDTHDSGIIQSVWDLYAAAVERFPTAATLIERDANIPDINQLLQELRQAKKIHANTMRVINKECELAQ
jgi:uncharacterized protein (UPF0276 family)